MHRDFSIGNSGSNALVVSGMDASTVWLTPVADKPWNTARIDDITGDGINDLIVGTLYSSNYCYFMNGTNGDPVFMNGTGTPVDALVAIQDITGDGSMEVLVGGRNGMVYCYSGGSDSSVGEQESPYVQDQIFVTARPNPFGELTQITLTLAQAGYCRVTIHDVNGRLISSLTEGYLTSGQHQFVWNGPERGNSNNITGMYFLRIYAGDECLYYKLIHI
jgi:hypothetical protein